MLEDSLTQSMIKTQSYHFQLVPIFLIIVGANSQKPAQGTTYRFSIHKGHHKFDQNRHPIQANFTEVDDTPIMLVSACKLNFFVPHYVKIRRQEFVLKLTQRECNQQFDIGEYLIDVASYIEEFKANKTNRFCLRTFFSQDYELDFQIYLEQNRLALENNVKEAQKQRNPYAFKQNRKEYFKETKNHSRSNSGAKSSQKDNSTKAMQQKLQKSVQEQVKKPEQKASLFRMFSDQNQNQNQRNDLSKSGQKVPLIYTKFKQLAKSDAPAQIVMSQSQILSSGSNIQVNQNQQGQGVGRKVYLMWIYILVMSFITYALMHPVRQV